MYGGGGTPMHLMRSDIFSSEHSKLTRAVEWRRIRELFRPYIKEELLLVLLIALQAGVGLVPSLLTINLIDKAIPHKNLAEVFLCTGGMIGAGLLGGALSVSQGYINSRMAEGVMRDLRCQIVSHLQQMPVEFFAVTRAGELLNRVSGDIDTLDDIVSGSLVTIVSSVLILTSTVITMFILDWRLALLTLALLPPMILPLWTAGKRMYKQRRITRKRRDEVANRSQESLSVSGVILTKIFGREHLERQRFLDLCNELMRAEISLAMIGRWFLMIISTMTLAGPALIWMTSAYLVIRGNVGLGTVIAFITLLTRLYGPASALTGLQVQIAGAFAVFERIFEYLDLKTEDYESGEKIDPAKVQGRISFENVSFSYENNQDILNNLSLAAEPGEFLAIVGSSGAGKSTVVALIPRLYNVQSGRICVDGRNIEEINLASLRQLIGIVTQESYLLHASIKENLLYANPEASMETIIEAARAANIHDFIISLPQAYDTIVGERGYKLSGGERQRVSIARALLKDPRILILDEATSSLDSVNEAAVQSALNRLMKGRTSIVIAHRLSTIQQADKILVLSGGRVAESGTHNQLLHKNGIYANLYRQQAEEM